MWKSCRSKSLGGKKVNVFFPKRGHCLTPSNTNRRSSKPASGINALNIYSLRKPCGAHHHVCHVVWQSVDGYCSTLSCPVRPPQRPLRASVTGVWLLWGRSVRVICEENWTSVSLFQSGCHRSDRKHTKHFTSLWFQTVGLERN